MPDYTVGDTVYKRFTTRAFATGIPTTLAGTPVVSAYEDDSVTQITAGITLGVDHDSVGGLNLLTIVATGANGYEAGKSYDLVITTGTVSSVSVVGEVVWHFTLSAEAAAVDLANGTDGLGAIKADTATVLVDTADMQPKLGSPAGASISADIAVVEGQTDDIGVAGAGLTALASAANLATVDSNVDAILVDTGTTLPATLATIDGIVDAILVDTGTTLPATLATIDGIVDAILVDTDTTIPALIAALNDPTAAAVAIAVWDALQSAHTTGGSFGETATEIATILANVNALENISPAEVNAEMVDVLRTDTIAELAQAQPAATPTIVTALMLLYMTARNKDDIDATSKEVHNDAGTVIAKKTLSDDGTTYSEAKMVSGP